jgi:hypothetical protein
MSISLKLVSQNLASNLVMASFQYLSKISVSALLRTKGHGTQSVRKKKERNNKDRKEKITTYRHKRMDIERERERERQTDRQKDSQMNERMDGQTNGRIDRRTDGEKHTDCKIERYTA